MTEYGSKQEPGIVTSTSSDLSEGSPTEAPNDGAVVAEADLGTNAEQGDADPNTVYEIFRASTAVARFGEYDTSHLTQNVVDALREGASPVYAVAPDSTDVSAEDHSSVSSTGFTLDNAPVEEDLSSMTVTVDGSDMTLHRTFGDPSNESPEAGEAYVNPVKGKIELESTPSTSLEVDYTYHDYASAIDAMANNAGDVIDFFGLAVEEDDASQDLVDKVKAMAELYELAIAFVGVDSQVDPDTASVSYDTGRVQALANTRYENGETTMGGYVGLKASTSLDTTVINKTLDSARDRRLLQSFDLTERGTLGDANIVAMADESDGPRISDDPTTVEDDNQEESNLRYGYTRSAFDYVINTVRTNQQPFIGSLNRPETRNTLEGLVNSQLTALANANVVLSHNVEIFPVDSTTIEVEISLDVADPLRFVENRISLS